MRGAGMSGHRRDDKVTRIEDALVQTFVVHL